MEKLPPENGSVLPGIGSICLDKTIICEWGKLVVKSAFLPPIMETEPFLKEYISVWISAGRNSGQSIICANASQLKNSIIRICMVWICV
jgi:hypothetical protein